MCDLFVGPLFPYRRHRSVEMLDVDVQHSSVDELGSPSNRELPLEVAWPSISALYQSQTSIESRLFTLDIVCLVGNDSLEKALCMSQGRVVSSPSAVVARMSYIPILVEEEADNQIRGCSLSNGIAFGAQTSAKFIASVNIIKPCVGFFRNPQPTSFQVAQALPIHSSEGCVLPKCMSMSSSGMWFNCVKASMPL